MAILAVVSRQGADAIARSQRLLPLLFLLLLRGRLSCCGFFVGGEAAAASGMASDLVEMLRVICPVRAFRLDVFIWLPIGILV